MAQTSYTTGSSLIPNGSAQNYHGAWTLGHVYAVNDVVEGYSGIYACISAHTATADDAPGDSVNWETYWIQVGDSIQDYPDATAIFTDDNENCKFNSNQFWIYVTRFGFSLPAGAIVDGVEAQIGALYYYDPGEIRLRLTKAGVPSGNDKIITINSSSETQYTTGGASDKWGNTLTKSDVENAGFGLYIREYASDLLGAEIDYVQIRITYHVSHNQALSDAQTFSETKTIKVGKKPADSQSITESVANKTTLGLSDAVGIVESGIFGAYNWEKSLSDSLSFSESLAKSLEVKRTLADSISIAEALSKKPTKKVSDIFDFADSLASVKAFYKSFTDSISISESVANRGTLRVTDSLSISEALTRICAFKKTLADTVDITEQIKNTPKKVLGDEISITEAFVSTKTFYLTISDSILIADGSNRELVLSLSDSIAITEAHSHFWEVKSTLTDAISLGESRAMRTGKSVADNQIISESLANQTTDRLSDTLGITDGLERIVAYKLTLSDTETIVESLWKAQERHFVDSETMAETLSFRKGRDLTDSITIIETLANQTTFKLTDALTTISETNSKSVEIPNMFEAVNIVPTISHKIIGKRPVAAVTMTDSMIVEIARKAVFTDSLEISETISKRLDIKKTSTFDLFDEKFLHLVKGLSETLSIAENVANENTISLSDSLTIAETITSLSGGGRKYLSDALAFQESNAKDFIKILSDSESISESLVKRIAKPFAESISIASTMANVQSLSQSDSLIVSESLTKLISYTRNLVESVNLAETNTKDIVKIISDTISITDSEAEKRVMHFEDSTTPFSETQSKVFVKNLADTETIVDSEGATYSIALGDSLEITETNITATNYGRLISDSVGFSENKIVDLVLNKAETEPINENIANSNTLRISDSISITEVVVAVYVFPLVDSLVISEAINKKDFVKQLTEALNIAESSAPEGIAYLNLSDSLSITETSIRKPVKKFTESVGIVESSLPITGKGFSETVGITETNVRVVTYHLSFTETMPIADVSTGIQIRPLADSIAISEAMVKRYTVGLVETLTIIEDFDSDNHPQERIGQMAFMRTRYF